MAARRNVFPKSSNARYTVKCLTLVMFTLCMLVFRMHACKCFLDRKIIKNYLLYISALCLTNLRILTYLTDHNNPYFEFRLAARLPYRRLYYVHNFLSWKKMQTRSSSSTNLRIKKGIRATCISSIVSQLLVRGILF